MAAAPVAGRDAVTPLLATRCVCGAKKERSDVQCGDCELALRSIQLRDRGER